MVPRVRGGTQYNASHFAHGHRPWLSNTVQDFAPGSAGKTRQLFARRVCFLRRDLSTCGPNQDADVRDAG